MDNARFVNTGGRRLVVFIPEFVLLVTLLDKQLLMLVVQGVVDIPELLLLTPLRFMDEASDVTLSVRGSGTRGTGAGGFGRLMAIVAAFGNAAADTVRGGLLLLVVVLSIV